MWLSIIMAIAVSHLILYKALASSAHPLATTVSKTNNKVEGTSDPTTFSIHDGIEAFRIGKKLVLRKKSVDDCLILQMTKDQRLVVEIMAGKDLKSTLGVAGNDDAVLKAEMNERIFGIYKLPAGYCIAFIRKSEPETKFLGESFNVRKVVDISFTLVPSEDSDILTGTIQWERHKNAIALMKSTFARHSFYFSSGVFDVTRSVQSNYQEFGASEKLLIPSWRHCDERFFWNLNVVHDLMNVSGLEDHWITPVTNAWVTTQEITVGKKKEKFLLTLVSRRSRRRQGPRYIKRGSDNFGDVANFVETEQVLRRVSDGAITSFVQIRGSIPIFWSQPDTWRLRPTIVPVKNLAQHARALKTHLLDLVRHYVCGDGRFYDVGDLEAPAVAFVNLIDKHGLQGQLGRWLYATFQTIQQSWVDAFAKEDEESWCLDNCNNNGRGEKKRSIPTEEHGADNYQLVSLKNCDEIPQRVERDKNLKDRKSVTQADFTVALSSEDVRRVSRSQEDVSSLEAAEQSATAGSPGAAGGMGALWNSLVNKMTRKGPKMKIKFIWFDYHKKCKGSDVDSLKEIFSGLKKSVLGKGSFFSCMKRNSGKKLSSSTASSSGVKGTEDAAGLGIWRHNRVDFLDPKKQSSKVNQTMSAAPLGTSSATEEGDEWVVTHLQHSVVRTNCIDCLDRTNVVQSTVARWALLHQLRELGVSFVGDVNPASDALKLPDEDAEKTFREMWGDNGDMMSMLYAGTPALKRDVTRHGKRTHQGTFDDGINSAMRYFINNYRDPRRQKGIDIMLGYVSDDGTRRVSARTLPPVVTTTPPLTLSPGALLRRSVKGGSAAVEVPGEAIEDASLEKSVAYLSSARLMETSELDEDEDDEEEEVVEEDSSPAFGDIAWQWDDRTTSVEYSDEDVRYADLRNSSPQPSEGYSAVSWEETAAIFNNLDVQDIDSVLLRAHSDKVENVFKNILQELEGDSRDINISHVFELEGKDEPAPVESAYAYSKRLVDGKRHSSGVNESVVNDTREAVAVEARKGAAGTSKSEKTLEIKRKTTDVGGAFGTASTLKKSKKTSLSKKHSQSKLKAAVPPFGKMVLSLVKHKLFIFCAMVVLTHLVLVSGFLPLFGVRF